MELYVITGVASVIALIIAFILFRRRTPNTKYYEQRWQEIQSLCSDKEQWKRAVIEADNLLNKALKRRRFPGKRMGERLTAAQKRISNNDSVWSAHKLRTKIDEFPEMRLKQNDVKAALIAFKQALKDLNIL